jgi:hypothetical protein
MEYVRLLSINTEAFRMRGLTGRDFVSKAFPPLESHFRGECSLDREISVNLDDFPLQVCVPVL